MATERVCAASDCDETFVPKRKNNIYCHPSCGHREANYRHSQKPGKGTAAEAVDPDADLIAKVRAAFSKRKTLTHADVMITIDKGPDTAARVLQRMAELGYNVNTDTGVISTGPVLSPAVEHFYGDVVRFGIISDPHVGSVYSMEDQVHEAYEVFRKEGIDHVYLPGNILDGEKTYRGQEYEIKVHGADNAVQYVADTWPKIDGVTTYFVASSTCHEGYYLKSSGLLIGKLIERERSDMVYLGLDEADVVLHDGEARPRLRIVHPGGGSSYAHSYRPQKIVESYPGGTKPTILVIGHYHKSGFYPIRNVMTIQAGCLQQQTPFMRKRSLEAMMGFWIIEATFTPSGSLRRMRQEWFQYYVDQNGRVLKDWA